MAKIRESKIELVARTELPGVRVADMPEEVQAKLREVGRGFVDAQLAALWIGPGELTAIVERHERELKKRLLDEALAGLSIAGPDSHV